MLHHWRIETEYDLDTVQPQARQEFLKQTAKLFWLGKFAQVLNTRY